VGKITNKYKNLVGKPERKRSLGRRGRRWEKNTNMDVKEIGQNVN
jgi:hypothetical protein